MQTKLESLLESGVNIIIGYLIALASQILIFPLYGIQITLSTNLWIGLWFTLVSLVRSYLLRRYFNQRVHKAIHNLIKENSNASNA